MHLKPSVFVLTVTTFLAFAATAYAINVQPNGGAIGSSYTVELACASEPRLYIVNLEEGIPPATLVPQTGAETSPGIWKFDVQAEDVDQLIKSTCGSNNEVSRYDVDSPQLFPGPTFAAYSDFRPDLIGSTVVGTDCPSGSSVTAVLTGSDGYSNMQTTSIDDYGNWQIRVPASAPGGDLTVNANCGDLTYVPIVLTHRPESSGTADPSTASSAPVTTTQPNGNVESPTVGERPDPAYPIMTNPRYTG